MTVNDATRPEAEAEPERVTVSLVMLTVNGTQHRLELDHRTSLLDALREHLLLTGSKKGCDHGQCGACTVLIDGRRANACLIFAVAAQRCEITTVEGLADRAEGVVAGGVEGGRLHPVQQAFIDRDAFQCGYCTPGQICSAVGMLAEAEQGWPSLVTDPEHERIEGAAALDADEVRERMSGNLCRCGAYMNIVPAILDVAR